MENNQSYYSHLLRLYPHKAKYFEWMKYELDNRVYYYGEHFKSPWEGKPYKQRLIKTLAAFKRRIIGEKHSIQGNYKGCILSEAYFSIGEIIGKECNKNVCKFPWVSMTGSFANDKYQNLIEGLSSKNYKELVCDEFCQGLELLFQEIKRFVSDNEVKLVVFPNDLVPIHRIAIDACKAANVKTAIFLHGLPARYDSIDDNRADFLCVWGEGIKEQYVKHGLKPEKILVTGHPTYSKLLFPKIDKVSLSNPLVISSSVCGAPSISDSYFLSDRGVCVNYAWSVQYVLQNLGVTHAVLRLHPSENPSWYAKYIDTSFYEIDYSSLSDSLSKSSVVIGPTTTVCIDATLAGKPFCGYEPILKYSYPLVSPFDNSEVDFPIALTIEELEYNVKNNQILAPEIFTRYISNKFNVRILLDKIK